MKKLIAVGILCVYGFIVAISVNFSPDNNLPVTAGIFCLIALEIVIHFVK